MSESQSFKNARIADPYLDRRSGDDRREAYEVGFFAQGGIERRSGVESRQKGERRFHCVNVSEWSSVCPNKNSSDQWVENSDYFPMSFGNGSPYRYHPTFHQAAEFEISRITKTCNPDEPIVNSIKRHRRRVDSFSECRWWMQGWRSASAWADGKIK